MSSSDPDCTLELELELQADYQQVLLCDDDLNGMAVADWTPEALERHLAVTPRSITLGTARDGLVPVYVELYDGEPRLVTELWDLVVDASLDVPTGRIVIGGLTEDWPTRQRIDVTPGSWRIRVSRATSDPPADDGVEADRYLLQLWSAPSKPIEVPFDITGRLGPTTEPPAPDDPFDQIDFSDTMKRILAEAERSGG